MSGRAEVKVQPGTQPGSKLRMRGYGVPMDAAGRPGRKGDQYVQVQVRVPRHLTPFQRECLEDFKRGHRSRPEPAAAKSAAREDPPSGAQDAAKDAKDDAGNGEGGDKGGSFFSKWF